MTLLNRKVDYALVLLSYLHHKAEGGCARAIAERFGLSRPFVANILKQLCQKGLVVSQRGIKGGYVLRKPAVETTVAQVMDALDDSFHLAECCRESPDDGCVMFGICPIKEPIAAVHRRIRAVLAEVTLAELFGPAGVQETTIELETSRCRQLLTVVRGE